MTESPVVAFTMSNVEYRLDMVPMNKTRKRNASACSMNQNPTALATAPPATKTSSAAHPLELPPRESRRLLTQQSDRKQDGDDRQPVLASPPQGHEPAQPEDDRRDLARDDVEPAEHEERADQRAAEVAAREGERVPPAGCRSKKKQQDTP